MSTSTSLRDDESGKKIEKEKQARAGEFGSEARKIPQKESSDQEMEGTSISRTTPTYGRKMPLVESCGLGSDPLHLASINEFPSESECASIDPSLRGPLNTLLEIRNCLIQTLKEGKFTGENAQSWCDQLQEWKGKHKTKDGIYVQNAKEFSSTKEQIPTGQELIRWIVHQIHDLYSFMNQRLSGLRPIEKELFRESSLLMEGEKEGGDEGYSSKASKEKESGERDVDMASGAKEGGTKSKKAAQLGSESY